LPAQGQLLQVAQTALQKKNSCEVYSVMIHSKRKSLRFNCKRRTVNIKTAFEEGSAVLVNISTSGCALVESTLQPEVEEPLFISFNLQEEDGLVEVRAKVLRQYPELAVQFTRIEPETESLILKFFVAESRALTNTKSIP
jgi:c-di-GMP-binding flagellar brake protein YcgR